MFSIYGLIWSNIRNSLDAEKAERLNKIYRFYRAEEDNQYNSLKLFELLFSHFEVPEIWLLFVLLH